MTRMSIVLLEIMVDMNATSPILAKSINEMLEDADVRESFSHSTLYRNLKSLVREGYLAYGLMDKRAETFYVSAKGIGLYKSLSGN